VINHPQQGNKRRIDNRLSFLRFFSESYELTVDGRSSDLLPFFSSSHLVKDSDCGKEKG
jgi:hypothetical protein